MFGTADDRAISIGDGLSADSQVVIYDAGSNVDVASGRTYPTAVRQTVTLLFGQALPAGSYRIVVSSDVASADFNDEEASLLSHGAGLSGHPIVQWEGLQRAEGAVLDELNLVRPFVGLGNFSVFERGTRFLTQVHNDLGALLDGEPARVRRPAVYHPESAGTDRGRLQSGAGRPANGSPRCWSFFLIPSPLGSSTRRAGL